MRGARRRVELEIEMRNRQAWQIANLAGAASIGKLPPYEQCFGKNLAPGRRQSPAVLAAMGRALAAVWGAEMSSLSEGS